MLSTSTSSEEDRRSAEPTPQGEEAAERASDPRERAVDLAGEEEDNYSPVYIPFARSNCKPQEFLGGSGASTVRNAGGGSLLKERLPGAKRTQW